MRLIDGEKLNGHAREPIECVGAGEALGRDVQQAVPAFARGGDQRRLFAAGEVAVERGGRDSHLSELGDLVLHEGDQRGNDDGGLPGGHRCGKLVAERFSSARRHDHAGVAVFEKAANDPVLEWTKRIVSPVAAQRR
jgi:hypothetical protein